MFGMPQKNLAVELERKLLNNEIRIRSKQTEVGGQRSNVRFDTSPRPSLHSPADTSSGLRPPFSPSDAEKGIEAAREKIECRTD